MVKYPLNQESIFNIKTSWTGVIYFMFVCLRTFNNFVFKARP